MGSETNLTSLTGRLLVAGPTLIDPNFFRTVVFILDHDEDGAFGVIINRPSDEKVIDHLPDLSSNVGDPDVVFVGGPVQPEAASGYQVAFNGDDGWIEPGVTPLDFEQSTLGVEARIFAGYAGWGSGQLEFELTEDAWIVVEPTLDDLFSRTPEGLWETVLRRQGGRLTLLSSYPPDPLLN